MLMLGYTRKRQDGEFGYIDMEEQNLSEENHFLRGIQLINDSDIIELQEEDSHFNRDSYTKNIETPFGLFNFKLSVPKEKELSSPDDDITVGEIEAYAISKEGEVIEDMIRNLVEKGYASPSFAFDDKYMHKQVTRANLWWEGIPLRLSDISSLRNVDLTEWATEDGTPIGVPWLPLDKEFLAKMRINFESIRGGEVN